MGNARVVGDFLYTRNQNGEIEEGHRIDLGDEIIVEDVSYSKQLVKCIYPTQNGDREAFAKNACIEYYNDHSLYVPCYRNVFDLYNGVQIGSVENESVTILEEYEDSYNIAYDTNKGPNTKSGIIYKWDIEDAQEPESRIDGSISTALVDFVKSYEGFYDHAYDDGTGVITIGYGTINKDKVDRGYCSEEEATEWLMEEINYMAARIKEDLDSKGVVLTQNQFDAICSFAYNCGVDGLLNQSNLYSRICQGVRDESLRENFQAWSNAGGGVMQGLLNRRNEECDMFLYADYIRNL